MKNIITYCRQHYQSQVKRTLFIADNLTEGIFYFDNPWDLEHYPQPVTFTDEIRWEETPNGDPEFFWQFNRHRYFICLGQAYALTGDPKYAAVFERIMKDWLHKVPLTKQHMKKGWRSIEAGFRGEYWTKGMQYFKGCSALQQDTFVQYTESMKEHAAYLESEYDNYKMVSNWGIIEAHGLFEIAMELTDTDGKEHYTNLALTRLTTAARIQIMDDGMHWEQSPLYHHEVLHCFLDVLSLAKKHLIAIPEELMHNVKKMVYAMIAFIKPNGHCFMNGDSDDVDIRDSLSAAAYIFHDPVMRFAAGDDFGYENMWFLGIDAALEYEKMKKQKPSFCSKALAQSGNFYLRSDWSQKANLLHFHCGTLGAGHGHTDKLHVDLVIGGRDVLVDSGRYTYDLNRGRIAFKDPQAHNTIVVDGEPYTKCLDSWECMNLSHPINRFYKETPDYELVQGGHLGYMNQGILLNRRIIHIKPDIYTIADEIYGTGGHLYEAYFHFSEKGSVTVEDNIIYYDDEYGRVYMKSLTEQAELFSIKSEIARHYNSKTNNDCIKICRNGIGFASFLTVISGRPIIAEKAQVKSALKGTIYQEDKAQGIKIITQDEEYRIAICHKEVNSPTDMLDVEEYQRMGNVILWTKSTGQYNGKVLLW